MQVGGERIKLTQINRLERGFTTIIKASAEFDLRNAARSKVANGSVVSTVGTVVVVVVTAVDGNARTIVANVPADVASVVASMVAVVASLVAIVASVVAVVASIGAVVPVPGPVIDVSRDDATLIIENRVICEIGGDTKDGVESVSLNTGLDGGSIGSGGNCIRTGVTSGSVSLASVHELVAHGTGDHVDVLSRTVGVGF